MSLWLQHAFEGVCQTRFIATDQQQSRPLFHLPTNTLLVLVVTKQRHASHFAFFQGRLADPIEGLQIIRMIELKGNPH